MYWEFEEEDLTKTIGLEEAEITVTPSFSGDDCHRDIIKTTPKGERRFVLDYCKVPNIYYETDEDDMPMSEEVYSDIENL